MGQNAVFSLLFRIWLGVVGYLVRPSLACSKWVCPKIWGQPQIFKQLIVLVRQIVCIELISARNTPSLSFALLICQKP